MVEVDVARASTPSSAANCRWKPIATLHRPTARCPAWSSARVTMPTGLVKSMIQASGLVRRTRSAMSRTTGHGAQRLGEPAGAGRLLADAAALQRPGLVLRRGPPARRRAAGAAPRRRRRRPASRSVGGGDPRRGGRAGRRSAGPAPPTSSSRSAAGSTRTSSSTGRVSRSRANPSTSSGVYVDPPPTTASFMPQPFTPVSVTPSTKAFWAKKNTTITGAMTSSGRGHGEVPVGVVRALEGLQAVAQRPGGRVLAGVDLRAEVVVPAVEELEQRDRRDARLGHRQDDPQQRAAARRSRRPWPRRGTRRDRQQELAQQEDRERVAEGHRDDQRPQRAGQVELLGPERGTSGRRRPAAAASSSRSPASSPGCARGSGTWRARTPPGAEDTTVRTVPQPGVEQGVAPPGQEARGVPDVDAVVPLPGVAATGRGSAPAGRSSAR